MGWALDTAVIGLTVGSIYALIAMGYNVVFASTGVLNFAHGQIFMAGMMVGAFTSVSLGFPMVLALVVTVGMGGLVGVVIERVAVRGIADADAGLGAIGWVLSILGFGIIIESGITLWMGPELHTFPSLLPWGPLSVGGVTITAQRIIVFVTAILAGVFLYLFIERSRVGRALSAIEQDSDAADIRGIPVIRLGVLSFIIAGGLAALAGFVTGPLSAAVSSIGLTYGLKGFVAAAAGGIPSIKGALIAGLALGLLEAYGAASIGAGYRDAIVFAALLLVLMIKPAGLFGAGSVRAV